MGDLVIRAAAQEYSGFFDLLYFAESTIGDWGFEDRTLTVEVQGVFLFGNHPLNAEGHGPHAGWFVFEGVTSSKRTLIECIGDPVKPDGFKAPREEVDDIDYGLPGLPKESREYGFEGYLTVPLGWVDWVVVAGSFKFVVDPLARKAAQLGM
ncbi:hypothetical protein [Stenotrophomonas sp. PS02289]|uniref:hypothetical protein n=1 Tax=Stenotrophomonas sp. PS02289 TaxID=2991422 RepID=UPI00249A9C9C|nr:hypothetical protein [Stenotrophomonas sp. PS02289]